MKPPPDPSSPKKKINSRSKGKRGELEFRDKLTEHGYAASRGQQRKGGPGSPDVICLDLNHLHFEVKSTERLDIYGAIHQAERDAVIRIPVVAHKRNKSRWYVTLPADDFLELIRVPPLA